MAARPAMTRRAVNFIRTAPLVRDSRLRSAIWRNPALWRSEPHRRERPSQSSGRIEQQTARGWEPVFEEFRLVEDCGAVATLPACVTLAPGASLKPVPWTGYTCRGQCPRPCKGNVYRPPGTFRLVLPLCGSGEVTGPPFFMGARPKR